MVTNLAPAKAPTYVKVANHPGLYRHTRSNRYYGCKKVNGARKEKSLDTCDRKIAERRLKEWIDNLDKVDTEVEKTTMDTLMKRYVAVTSSLSESSRATDQSIIKRFWAWWPHGRDFQVRQVRPSMLDEWLAHEAPRLRNVSYNGYASLIRQVFDIAVKDRIIAESPAKSLRVPWKKPQAVKRIVPTAAQFQSIIDDIRSLPLTYPLTRYTEESADFLEFLGLAGVGQAEASSLTWGDVDWKRGHIHFRRHKTDTHFYVPIYEHLRPLLVRLKEGTWGRVPAAASVFKIKDAKKALAAACTRLNFPPFSQRNLRQHLIGRLWRAGVDKKLIARWQGHQDGGQLVMDTYTEVFGDDDEEYERGQLNKIAGGSAPAAVLAHSLVHPVVTPPSGTMKKSRMKAARPRPAKAAPPAVSEPVAPTLAKEVAPASMTSAESVSAPAVEVAAEPETAPASMTSAESVSAPAVEVAAEPKTKAMLIPSTGGVRAPGENPYTKGDKVKTKCKGQEVEAEVTAVFKAEVQVRTPDGELRWRTVGTVVQKA